MKQNRSRKRPIRATELRWLPGLAVALLLSGCAGETTSPVDDPGEGAEGLTLHLVASGLSSPVYLTAPLDDDRLFIVEQAGRIRVQVAGSLLPTPFLDISSKVLAGGERGLLGLAFDPDYMFSRYFFVYYTDLTGATRIERYQAFGGANPNVANPASATLLLTVPQPFANHNGGQIFFGPLDLMYVGLGDGGSSGDPLGNSQDPTTLLGKLLRLDASDIPYDVPEDNPFYDSEEFRQEIWATGLRNPWRFSIDDVTGLLYVGDVGQNRLEEINVASFTEGGVNYGWNIMEGTDCYASPSCSSGGLRQPAVQYDHSEGCSVIGGYVYRGSAIPSIAGHYFYSDYCAGWLRSFRYSGGAATDKKSWNVPAVGNVLSMGMDGFGELYVLSSAGSVYRLEKDQ